MARKNPKARIRAMWRTAETLAVDLPETEEIQNALEQLLETLHQLSTAVEAAAVTEDLRHG